MTRRESCLTAALAVPAPPRRSGADVHTPGCKPPVPLEVLRLAGRTSEAVGYRAGGREARPGRAAAGAKPATTRS